MFETHNVAVTDEHVMHRMRRPTRTARGLTCDPLGERVEYGMVMTDREALASFGDATRCPVCYQAAASWSVAVGLPVTQAEHDGLPYPPAVAHRPRGWEAGLP